jgi:hypothetical protein
MRWSWGRRRFEEKWRPGSLFVGGIGKIGARNDVMMSVWWYAPVVAMYLTQWGYREYRWGWVVIYRDPMPVGGSRKVRAHTGEACEGSHA